MKGIILAGGQGTRLRPFTDHTNKHLLPVGDRPMIYYPIRTLVDAGIDDVLIVTGRRHVEQFERALSDGGELGVRRLGFAAQDGAGGIAHALLCAETFAAGQRACVILGDQILERSIRDSAEAFTQQASGAKVLLHEVDDPRRFGSARFDGDRLVEIIEKPDDPPSQLAVTGIYFYDGDVFDICRSVEPSPRGELEITGVNNAYLQRGDLTWRHLPGWWIDVGTRESLERADAMIREESHAEAQRRRDKK